MKNELNWDITIPHYVLNDRNLSFAEIIIYAYIRGLTRQKGYCWATNDYLSELIGRSKSTGMKAVLNLKELGYIICLYSKTEKEVTVRRIYLNEESNIPNVEQALKGNWFETEKEVYPLVKNDYTPSAKTTSNRRLKDKEKIIAKAIITNPDGSVKVGKRINRASRSDLVRKKAKEAQKKIKDTPPEPLFLSAKFKSCIEYWNNKACLRSTLVNTDKPTKQLKKTKEALALFFKETLFSSAKTVMPKGITLVDIEELSSFSSEEDLMAMIDRWVEVLNGNYNINVGFLSNLTLLDFLQGNRHIKNGNGGLIAPIVSHVYRTPPRKEVDLFIKDTSKMKERWESIIAVPEKESQDEFVKASNFINALFLKKSWTWKPSTSPYTTPVACFLEVLVDNKQFIRDKNMEPSIINKTWFRDLIIEVSKRRS